MVERLSENEIDEIKLLLSQGIRQVEIARRFDVTQAIISQIKTGKRYNNYTKRYITGFSDYSWTKLERIAKKKDMKLNEYIKYVFQRILESNKDII